MSPPRRGACPTLAEPMATGDGLLARLHLRDRRLSGAQLAGLAEAARLFGNGIVEISLRGHLQIRGLREASVAGLSDAVAKLGLTETDGPVETGALAGIDASQIADPRPLAEALRIAIAPFAARLAPKVSVTVDGGGALSLRALTADVKLCASDEGWWMDVAGRRYGPFDEAVALAKTLGVIENLVARGREARGRDLEAPALAVLGPGRAVEDRTDPSPVGRFALSNGGWARGLALPFGQIEAPALHAFACALGDDADIRLAPGRGLLVLVADDARDASILAAAGEAGLVATPGDPRLTVSACAGAPACASALLPARRMALELSKLRPRVRLHVSGCEKGCGCPPAPLVALVGRPGECDIRADGIEPDAHLRAALVRSGEAGLAWRKGQA